MSELNNEKLFYNNFYKIFFPIIGAAYDSNPAYKQIYEHIGVFL